jgi:hypothetical protein
MIGSTILSCLAFPASSFAEAISIPDESSQDQTINLQAEKSVILGKVATDASVIIDGKTQPLYPTFISQEEALSGLKEAIPEFLKEISQAYGLDEINDSNWTDYVNYANERVTDEQDPQ